MNHDNHDIIVNGGSAGVRSPEARHRSSTSNALGDAGVRGAIDPPYVISSRSMTSPSCSSPVRSKPNRS